MHRYNFGLHDGATPLDEYTANLRNITATLVAAAKQINATLIFVTTTIPGGASEVMQIAALPMVYSFAPALP